MGRFVAGVRLFGWQYLQQLEVAAGDQVERAVRTAAGFQEWFLGGAWRRHRSP
jgi:hypothetical protein